ncbi:MAG TPA: acyl-CoA synthetase [Terriglobales bacterium]|nr:acyl-CoA synthetase [Terriglobales bacterium]
MPPATVPDVIARAQQYRPRTAIVDCNGSYTYEDLLAASARVSATLLAAFSSRPASLGRGNLREQRIAFLITPGFPWVAVQWGIWRAGGVAVPLPLGTPWTELEYYIADTQASAVICDAANEPTLASANSAVKPRVLRYEQVIAGEPRVVPVVANTRRAMILYTSGTTSRPKGVVTTHANIAAQITSLVEAWEWSAEDRILLCLPLHHVHGIINVVSCALWSGATCEMLPRFDAETVWERISSCEPTLFMAVPTIYVKLISAWEKAPGDVRSRWSEGAARLRLMVSGSAALPMSTLQRWREISGHMLLERYGMTEIGMAISNSYRGERIPGSVGRPLPGVAVRLADEGGCEVSPGNAGEIEVQGPNVFLEYWGNPVATCEAFRNGWFRTGDTAVLENGAFRILGRSNVDILKTGGHKVSALEIEEVLREHPAIVECAVVGVADAEWGERVATAVVTRSGYALRLEDLRAWAKERMATHKVPSRLLVLNALPRNAMGKVMKPAIRTIFEGQ